MRDVNSDTCVLLDIDMKLENVCLPDCGFTEVQFSEVAAVSFMLSCVASDDTWLCVVDVTPFAPTTNDDVQSCLQALITTSAATATGKRHIFSLQQLIV